MTKVHDLVGRLPAIRPRVAFLLIVLVHGGYVAWRGAQHGGDTAGYDHYSDRLLASGFDYATLLADSSTTYPAPLYLLFVTLLALIKLVAGSGWPAALLSLNVLADAGSGAILVRLIRRLTGSNGAVIGGLLLYLICYDVVHWSAYLLTDTIFLFVAFAISSLVMERLLAREGAMTTPLIASVVAAFVRPPGVVLLPWILWTLLLRFHDAARRRIVAFSLLVAAILAGTVTFTFLLEKPERLPFGSTSSAMRETVRSYRAGEVMYGRPETNHDTPASVVDYAAITADRFLHFFHIASPAFSRAHVVVQMAFFIPVYLLCLILAIGAVRRPGRIGGRRADAFLASLGFVLAFATFHALIQVDFDWRYRLPVMPHLILLASGGLAMLDRSNRDADERSL